MTPAGVVITALERRGRAERAGYGHATAERDSLATAQRT